MKKVSDLQKKVESLREAFALSQLEKSPRLYAADILRLRTAEQRRQALEKVPADIRYIVHFYVADHFAKMFKKPLPVLSQPVCGEAKPNS